MLYCRIAWRIAILLGASRADAGPGRRTPSPRQIGEGAGDIFFLARLFRSDPWLWLWEWLFHASFALVIARHLRYVLDPVPSWVALLQPMGMCAGFVLPLVLLFILTAKLNVEKRKYISSYNFLLLSLLIVISASGIVMKTIARPDLLEVKRFALGIASFSPGVTPPGLLFVVHYLASIALLVVLPTHVFAAPFTILAARVRERDLREIMHE